MHWQRWNNVDQPDLNEWIAAGGPVPTAWRDRWRQQMPAAVAVHPSTAAQADPGNVLVVAKDPHELVAAQHLLIEQVERKKAAAIDAAREQKHVLDQLVAAGLDPSAAKRRHRSATRLVVYYDKAVEALRAGYVLVPDMPAESFAIRIGEGRRPRREAGISYSPRSALASIPLEAPDQLPAGEGRYTSPFPRGWVCDWEVEREGRSPETRYQVRGLEFGDEPIGIPSRFERPTVVDRLSQAMAGKLFDELATIDNTNGVRRGDPMVVGYIRGESGRRMCFLIAWFIDTAEL